MQLQQNSKGPTEIGLLIACKVCFGKSQQQVLYIEHPNILHTIGLFECHCSRVSRLQMSTWMSGVIGFWIML